MSLYVIQNESDAYQLLHSNIPHDYMYHTDIFNTTLLLLQPVRCCTSRFQRCIFLRAALA